MEDTQNNTLPFDVQTDILLKLPVKSLVRFRCVSKCWRTLITSHRFINLHRLTNNQTNQPQNSNASNLVVLVGNSKILTYEFSGSQVTCKLPSPPILFNSYDLIGSSNGILCLRHPSSLPLRALALYNPTTGDYRVLMSLMTCEFEFHVCHDNAEFGYDHTSNDFKIVSLQQDHRPYIYRLRNNSWEIIELHDSSLLRRFYGIFTKTMVIANNALHWHVKSHASPGERTSLLAFDLGNEEFYEVPLPERDTCSSQHCKDYCEHIDWELANLRGYLHLSIVEFSGRCSHCFPRIEIWIMKEYGVKQSWTKLLHYSLKEVTDLFANRSTPIIQYPKHIWPQVYGYSKDGQEILVGLKSAPKNFFSCHLQTREVKKVSVLSDEKTGAFRLVPWTCTFACIL
ncbi:F-box/kelch-repeat protein At3g23880-like [Silene latifolia]|uniref:F-box/kelch-repeat protein At3g23880-like n=1 Tax=Silene latifolia TaxID=37657 RepID=UPI003D786256